MVVDDDTAVRKWVAAVLQRNGYEIDVAATGDEALRILAANGDLTGLLLTDIRMPGMNGIELAWRARQERPSLKVLYMSGFSCEAVEEGDTVLRKPFTSESLAGEVARLLRE